MADDMTLTDTVNDEKKALKNHVDTPPVRESNLGATNHDSFNDASHVKIIGEKDSEASSTFIDRAPESNEHALLKKEELAKYATDPFWVRVRIALLVLFGLAWAGMLAAAIAIIVLAPKCPPEPRQDWWQKAVIYHIHPQSFLDSNEDGFGDIKGILEKVDYLKDNLHVNAVCIGPMHPTPNFNYGYNIANFNITCPGHYGTTADLESLRAALHKRGIKLLLDFVPNHTSRRHKWFNSSAQPAGVSSAYKDYYIWHPGHTLPDGTRQPPNNWLSVYGGSAWTFNEQRKEFYYHTFSEDEPDLNLRNEAVIAELDAVLNLWLRRGVDGFRFYGAQYLVESANLTDNEPRSSQNTKEGEYDSLMHVRTAFQPESYKLVTHWRKLLDDFSNNDGKAKSRYYPRLMIVEVNGTTAETLAFGETNADGLPGAHIATNKALVKLNSDCRAECVYELVTEWYEAAEERNVWSNWQLGNVDASRVGSRFADDVYLNALNVILLTLPGTPLVYYGEELGMKDVLMNADTCKNLSIVNNNCRLANRAPMQWSDEAHAGFTTGNKTWMPVNDNYHIVSVKAQLAHGAGISPLVVFSNITELRRQPSFQWGKFYPSTVANVFFFVRQAVGFPGFLVAVNLGPQPSTVDFSSTKRLGFSIPATGKVVATTGYFDGPGRHEDFRINTEIQLTSVHLKQGEGIVLQWEAAALG